MGRSLGAQLRLLPALAGAMLVSAVPAAAQAGQVDAERRGCDPIDPSVCLQPFPNDYFTVADDSTDTGRRVNLPITGMPRNAAGKPIDPTDINRADGWSPGSLIVTKVPGLDTPEAFAATGSVPITDIARYADPDAPVVVIDAATGERHPIWTEIDSNPQDPADRPFIIRPAKNFLEGHRYIVALRNLKDAGGEEIEASSAFRRFRDGRGPDRARRHGRPAQMEAIFADLAAAGIAREELYLAWDFTVASADSLAGRMLSIRDDAFARLGDHDLSDLTVEGASPKFEVERIVPSKDPRLERVVHGTFEVPCYLAGGANCEPGQRFAFATGDKPAKVVDGVYNANFSCNIAKSTSAAAPARPSLYGHGLLGNSGEIGQSQLKSFGNEHNMIFCATDWDGMSFEDVPTIVGLVIPDFSNFPVLADRVQQGMLNQLFLGRLMLHEDGLSSHPAFQEGGQGIIDRERLFYDGNSQGGIIGGALTAVAVDHDRAVLGVPGMNYSTLLQRSSDFVGKPLEDILMEDGQQVVEGLIDDPGDQPPDGVGFSTLMYEAYPREDDRQLMFSLIQMLWDRAEANGYAQHMTSDPLPGTPAHEVLLHVALGDHQVAPVTTEVEARTIGARLLNDPLTNPGRHSDVDPFFGIPEIGDAEFPFSGSALVWWDSGSPVPPTTNTADHSGQDPHEFPRRQPAARLQKSEFLKVDGRVIDVCNDAPCLADPGA